MSFLELIFVCLLGLQLIVIAGHDWITVPGWNHAHQVQAVVGRRKLAWATAINALFPAGAFAAALWYFHAPKPEFVRQYWFAYTAITVLSAFLMWWLPYFFESRRTTKEDYDRMYAGTRHVLPSRHGHRGPNAVHLGFHLLFLTTLIYSAASLTHIV